MKRSSYLRCVSAGTCGTRVVLPVRAGHVASYRPDAPSRRSACGFERLEFFGHERLIQAVHRFAAR
jgi:hypothetical protein